tara:strand:- start:1029 stop:1607 length:579 start_codon:yes stop_codon:yes gene_type:complete
MKVMRHFWLILLCAFVYPSICISAQGGDPIIQKMEQFPTIISISGTISMAVAVMMPTRGHDIEGAFFLYQKPDGVQIEGMVSNLNPNQTYSVRVHASGDLSYQDGSKLGGLYNPQQLNLTDRFVRHPGNLGEFSTNKYGDAKFKVFDQSISIFGRKNPVLGRAIAIHTQQSMKQKNDQQPVAMGVIGRRKGN